MRTRLVYPIILAICLILIFTTIITFSQPLPSAMAASAGAQLFQGATPTPTLPVQVLSTQYSSESVWLVVGVFLLLAMLFGLLFWWSNKLDQAGYLGTLYRDTLEEIEYGRIATALREKFDKGEYHREVYQDGDWLKGNQEPIPPAEIPDEGYYRDGSTYSDYGTPPGDAGGYSSGSTSGIGSNPGQDQIKLQQLRSDYYQKYRVWNRQYDLEAKRRHSLELGKARGKAKERAASAISSVDLSVLRGRGSEFVLEFTTVVVIIFAAFALGVLRILDTQQIGTLLAAIAGYVLGRATSRTQTKTGEGVVTTTDTRTGINTTEIAELLRAVGAPTTPAVTPTAPAVTPVAPNMTTNAPTNNVNDTAKK